MIHPRGCGRAPQPRALGATLALAALLAACAHTPPAAQGPPRAFPDLLIAEILGADPLPALGVATGTPFRLSQIAGEVLVLEFFNSRCGSCQRQARELEQAARILGTPAGRVRVLAVGAGDRRSDLEAFRADYGVSYPLVPDPWYQLYGQLGSLPRPPVTYLLRREGPGGNWTEAGALQGHAPAAALVAQAGAVLTGAAAAEAEARQPEAYDPPLGLDHAGQQARALALLRKVDPAVVDARPLELAGRVRVFRGLLAGGRGAGLYARLASREPPCDVCHAAHFLLIFDDAGVLRGFEPLYVAKAGNAPLDPAEARALEARLVGRPAAELSFDPAVDAVTGATLSASIIFDEARRTGKLITELQAH